jgi:hypothetical protein
MYKGQKISLMLVFKIRSKIVYIGTEAPMAMEVYRILKRKYAHEKPLQSFYALSKKRYPGYYAG